MTNVLIGGGTGLVGMRLSELLKAKGYQVFHLSRRANLNAPFPAYQWDVVNKTIDEEAIKKADYIINLAGAGIADKLWSASRKQLIIDSRVDSTLLIKEAIEKYNPNVKAFLSASAIGYYGNRGDQELDEQAAVGGNEFLVESVVAWEKAIQEVAKTNVRTAWIRIGLVLSTQGGALPKIVMPAKANVGGYFGSGKQWYAWIHLDDVCQMFIHLLENENLDGVFNGASPYPETNKSFTQKVGKALGKNLLLIPAPAFALRTALGEMSTTVLNSTKVLPKRMEAEGFRFQFPTLIPALEDLFDRKI